jgi:hypothetical protein
MAWLRGIGLAFLIPALGAGSAARADNIDAALLRESPKVMKFLQDRHYRNVGVLKFRIQKGDRPVTFKAGTLNANLPLRLENALILADTGANPIGMIHDADKVAAARNLPSYTNATGRQRLFQESFPLAWGSREVRADAFLTGVVTVAPDLRKATVIIEAFDRDARQLSKVRAFEVDTDRTILADIGQSFLLSRGLTRPRDFEIAAADDAVERDQKKTSPLQSSERLVDLEIRYDGVKQEMTPDPSTPGNLAVAEPRENQAVSFVIRNISQEKVGVVLMINGDNTLFGERGEPLQCSWRIVKPGEEREVTGINEDYKVLRPFTVLSEAESEAVAYTDKVGLIELHVIRAAPESVKPESAEMEISRSVSLRGVTGYEAKKLPSARSLQEVQARLRGTTGVKKSKPRGLIVKNPGAPPQEHELQNVDFPDGYVQMTLVIRYYKPKNL